MIIVTSGSTYVDIDAYAGCIAYAELLNLLGTQAKAVSSAPLNASITPAVLAWGARLESHISSPGNRFVLIDVSDPAHLDPCVVLDNVIEVFDHHSGFEEYWHDRLGTKASIERIGAACTAIFERWNASSAADRMSCTTARLLLTAILENTLNFLAHATTDRDIAAYEALLDIARLPDDWARRYFLECQSVIENGLDGAIRRDTKSYSRTSLLPMFLGQITVWNGWSIIRNMKTRIRETMERMGDDWVLNVISINDERSFLVAENADSQKKLSTLLGVEFNDGVAVCDRLYLRKEILRTRDNALV
jgi:inorganic pyrophosphatase/manganese-dependent inorganic pyrophosphatase